MGTKKGGEIMLYKVTGKCRGSIWHEKYCGECGRLIDEVQRDATYEISELIDADCAEIAMQQALDSSDIDDPEDVKWIKPLMATLVPVDQLMWMLGAPMLFDV